MWGVGGTSSNGCRVGRAAIREWGVADRALERACHQGRRRHHGQRRSGQTDSGKG